MSNLFETKDLIVNSASIGICRECSETRYFVSMRSGKYVTVAKTEKEAVDFSIAYQKLIQAAA